MNVLLLYVKMTTFVMSYRIIVHFNYKLLNQIIIEHQFIKKEEKKTM